METLLIPNENDFKRWIREAVDECLKSGSVARLTTENEDNLLNRIEVAEFLRVSLVTLTDWMKRGLPFHKQRGRVYFMKSEVLNYIKENKMSKLKFGSKYHHLKHNLD